MLTLQLSSAALRCTVQETAFSVPGPDTRATEFGVRGPKRELGQY